MTVIDTLSGATLRRIDLARGRGDAPGPELHANAVAVDALGTYIVVGCADGTVVVLRAAPDDV